MQNNRKEIEVNGKTYILTVKRSILFKIANDLIIFFKNKFIGIYRYILFKNSSAWMRFENI